MASRFDDKGIANLFGGETGDEVDKPGHRAGP
jgi:hypothetical protein